ncbi:MAG: AbrB family transcriptional regulator [Pseudonocardia sp.]
MTVGSRWALLVLLTAAGSVALGLLGVPSPSLFAGLAAGTALALAGRAPGDVPRGGMVAAQAVIGVVIGLTARPETLAGLGASWLPVLLVSVATLLVSMGAGLALGLVRGVTPLTGMLALTAGGASGLVAISRELGGDDRVVAVVQYLRVGLITAAMPVVAVLLYGASATAGAGLPEVAGPPWWVGLGVTVACCAVGVPLGLLTRMPAGALLGPMIVAVGFAVAGWAAGAVPPELVVEPAYAVIGWAAGIRFTRESLRGVLALLPWATVLIGVIIALCAGLGVVLSHLTGTTLLEGYLATTPGGVFAVLATAISSGADATFVVAVQVLRVLMMLLVAPVLARLVAARGGG